MKWEDLVNKMPPPEVFENRIKTNVECPKCGKLLWKRTDIVLTSYPPQYQYECDCGWWGSAHT